VTVEQRCVLSGKQKRAVSSMPAAPVNGAGRCHESHETLCQAMPPRRKTHNAACAWRPRSGRGTCTKVMSHLEGSSDGQWPAESSDSTHTESLTGH
jgi:hypothetical protein